jgi:hypothetical protein
VPPPPESPRVQARQQQKQVPSTYAPKVGEEDPAVAATTLRPSAGASSSGHPSILMAVSQDVDASARRTTDPTPLSPVQEELPVPPNADDATPCEAARRLARFIDEVRIERPPPLIASPPKQAVPIRRHPVVKRSTRIVARPLSHIPTSRRGEVLLNMRMGIEPPPAPVSPAHKSLREAIRTGNLTSSQIDALDGYFPAAIR